MKGVDDDDETSKKPEEQLSSLPVTAECLTQDQMISSRHTASKKKQAVTTLSSATNSSNKLPSQTSNNLNHANMGLYDIGHHNTLVTAESELLQKKQRIAGRRGIVNTNKQEEFAEEATVEKVSLGIHDDIATGPSVFIKEIKMDTLFAEEALEHKAISGTNDDQIKHSQKSDKMTMIDGSKKYTQDLKIDIIPMAHNSYPLNQHSMKSHDPMMSYQLLQTAQPGALAMFPTGSIGSAPSTPNDDTISIQDDSQHHLVTSTEDGDIEAHEPALNAVLVSEDPSVLANATVLDIEAEKKFHQRRRMRTMVGTLIIASIIAIAVAIPVVLTRPDPPPATFSPSSSPGPSATPSFLPTVRPSIHPSWVPSSSPSSGLFGFLADNSFDGGIMLAIAGSSQQRAMDWLLEVSGLSELDYYLLQSYALVTLYFETYGRQWISQVEIDEMRLDLGSFPNRDSQYIGEWLNTTPSVNPTGSVTGKVYCAMRREKSSH